MKLKGGRSSKKTKMGKIKLPMDLRDKSQVPAFEEMLTQGPMMLVLVYADWCGHCTKYKDNVWNPLKNIKDRKMNMASIHYDQLPNTSLKNSKIEGYPSLLVSGPDKTPATFKNADGTSTNAMPKANDFTSMKNLVTSPVVNVDEEEKEELPKISSSLNKEPTNISDTLESAVTTKPVNSSVNTSTSKNMNSSSVNSSSEELPPLTNTNTNTTSSLPKITNTNRNKNLNSSSTNVTTPSANVTTPSTNLTNLTTPSTNLTNVTTPSTNLESLAPMMSEETTPPTISEDVVSLTNNSKTLNNSTAPPPIAMMGGRLYRLLSYKKMTVDYSTI